MLIPPSKAEIQTTNKGCIVVNNDKFLMMGPVERHVCNVLKNVVVRMAHNNDIAVALGSTGAQSFQSMFRVCAIVGYSCLEKEISVKGAMQEDFCILRLRDKQYIYLDTLLSLPFQNLIKTPFLVVMRWSAHEQFGRQPPICDINGFLRALERN